MKPPARCCAASKSVVQIHTSFAAGYSVSGMNYRDGTDRCVYCMKPIIVVHRADAAMVLPIIVTMYRIREWP